MKILVAAGAFKHSLSAIDVTGAIIRGIERSGLQAETVPIPIADGGNGTLDAWLARGGERVSLRVHDPLMRPVEAAYGVLLDGQTAVIEMALASGIELLADAERDPMRATTYGTGELMRAALERGARRFIIGMGGSATVDGGAGALQALGVRLLDNAGQDIPPGGGGLNRLAHVDTSGLDAAWHETEIIIASDVENLTLGDEGAAAVFGPQKGATPQQVNVLERNLDAFFTVIAAQTGNDVRTLKGGGAAGALSAGLIAVLGGEIQSGIDLLLDYYDFEQLLQTADLVITGEGQMDDQTIYGKGPIGVARLARKHGVSTVALVGSLSVNDTVLHEEGIYVVLPVVDKPMPLSDALQRAPELVERAAQRLGYMLQL